MRVAIVCGAPSSEMLAPFDDKDVEIWVLGNRLDHYKGKRFDRIFEIHDNLSEHGDVEKYKNYLLEHATGKEIIVGEKFFDDKTKFRDDNWVIFDYECSKQLFGSLYLTSSPAYMISYAISQGATEIGIYGVDLSIGDHEYFWQRPCVEAWIGFARGRGIRVLIPEVSHVGKSSYIEGRQWNNDTEVGVFSEDGFEAMASQHLEAHDNIQKKRQELALLAAAQKGGADVYKHLARVARAVEAQVDVKDLTQTTVLR